MIPLEAFIPTLVFLLLALFVSLSLYYSKRKSLIDVFADPRNTIVTFITASDYTTMAARNKKGGLAPSSPTMSSALARPAVAAAKEPVVDASLFIPGDIEAAAEAATRALGGGGAPDTPKGSRGQGGSIIFLKNSDPANANNNIDYKWEIPFKEIRLIERVGSGMYGDVYRGEWLDTEVAVKIPNFKKMDDDSIGRFLREVKLMSFLHHPNIVLFLGACITAPDVCLVMEYLSEGNLYDFLHFDTRASNNETLMRKFSVDIARGMKYLHHRARIIQRVSL